MRHTIAFALLAALTLQSAPGNTETLAAAPEPAPSYDRVVRSVANMLSNSKVSRLVHARGLDLLNVLWEDTGRYLGSSVGPNISDVTIEVESEGRRGKRTHLMPVIRYPNFTDKTADVKLDTFFVRVGNHDPDGELRTISLRELLANPTQYMSLPDSGRIKRGSLLARRDRHVLVSAQSAFLPVPQGEKATFYPVIFNYQSYAKNPAVLVILATRQGTSMTIVDNSRDTVTGGSSWGQRLYFNAGGERAPLTAERLADVVASGTTSNGEAASSLGRDANLLMLIQVPLKVKQRRESLYLEAMDYGAAPSQAAGSGMALKRASREDLDVAVLGHGPTQGPYTELDGLTIERDDRFPIRVTVQFYQATATGVIGKQHVSELAKQIDKVYAKGDYVGSLVVPDSTQPRPTQWSGTSPAPANLSWADFPGLHERYQMYGRIGRSILGTFHQ